MVKRPLAIALIFLLEALLITQTGIGAAAETASIQFRDVTQQAGIRFVHNNGAFGKKFLPETMGPGVAFIDYDNDGWPDIFLVNGMDWPGHVQKHSTPKLYHNNHDGTFSDVTHKAGLDVELFGMGVAVLDYDNDGFDDLLFSNDTQPNKLYRNNGDGTFTEKAIVAGVAFSEDGVARAGMGVDASDYDHSGYPSLLITNFSNQMISLYHNAGKGHM